jgi:hypothetical protein
MPDSTPAEEFLRACAIIPGPGWAPGKLEALLAHLRGTQSGADYDRSVQLLLNAINPTAKPVYRTKTLV